MEKGKSSTLGSARCRFKKGRDQSGNKIKVTTASDVWMSILERYFLNPVFGNAANVGLRCSVLNGDGATCLKTL